MNIPIMLLSKSTFTVIPSCIPIFSTPMFSYTSLNILNVLLVSLCLSSPFAVFFGISVHVLFYCAFSSIESATTFQFYYSFFLSVLHSGHKISLFSCSNILFSIAFFLLYSTHCTFVISLLFTSLFLQFHTSWQRSHHIFFTCLSRKKPWSWFSWVYTPLLLYPLHSTYVATTSSVIYPLSSKRVP